MASERIKAILFDLGETLLNFGKVDTSEVFSEAGRISYEYLKQLDQPVGSFRIYFWRNLLGLKFYHLWSNITKKDFDSLAALKKYGLKRGFNLTEAQWEHLNWLWYLPLSKKAYVEPDLKKTLKNLADSGIKLGILSNTFVHGSSLDRHLEQEGVLGYFKTRVYSCDFNCRKPDRRIFISAAELIGVKPKNIMFVGDRIDADINGALGAGMSPVMKTAYTNERKRAVDGVPIISTVSELPALVENTNRKNPVLL